MLHRLKAAKRGTSKEKLTRFQRFGLFFYTRTRMTLLLWMLIAAFGAVCYTTLLQREGFPNVAAPFSTVSGTYFVNDSSKVDREVAKPIATEIAKLGDVKQVGSQAGSNFFSLQIEFKESVKSADGNKQVEDLVKSKGLLPKGADAEFKPLFVSKLTMDGDDMLVSVASNSLNQKELQEKAGVVVREMSPGGVTALEGAQRVHLVDNFRTGTDPATGEKITEQKSFDWIAHKEGDHVSFRPSVLIAIQAKEGVDILKLDQEVTKAIDTLASDAEFNNVQVSVAADFAESIRTQIHSLQKNLLEGLLVVLLVSFVLISFRASIITSLAMVTVLAGTVGILYLTGFTLNTITLFSLILCLGLIVDDTTIMVEAIDKGRRAKNVKPRDVVAGALKKVALASSAGTLVTMMGFAPLLFISGIMGEFIHAIPVTIIVSLAMSLLVSVCIMPFLAKFTLLRGKTKKSNNPVAKAETAIAHGLAQAIRRVGRSRKQGVAIGLSAILLSFVMLFAGVFYMGKLKFDIFPPTKDSDAMGMSLTFTPGSTIADADKVSEHANQIVNDTIGGYIKRVSYQGSGNATNARATIELVSFKDRDPTAPELAKQLQTAFDGFAGAQVEVAADAGPAPTGGFAMQIRSEDSAKAEKLAVAIRDSLQGRELKRPDGTAARIEHVDVVGVDTVQRATGARYLEVNAKFNATDTSALVALTQDAVKKDFPADRLEREFGLSENVMKFDIGQESENQESFKSMIIAFPILLLAMFVLLGVQFRSFSQPILIFLAIPFSFFGVAAGLYYTGNSFSFFTMLAIFALLGIAVNNTILLTDYANKGRKNGLRRSEAMATAIEERFRPLLTTSITSVVALIPLALSDPFWEALAVTLIFGLISSTFLVIIAFPYYYLGNELIRATFNRWWTLGWIALLVVGSVVLGRVGKQAVVGYLLGYVGVTIAYFALRKVKRRKAE